MPSVLHVRVRLARVLRVLRSFVRSFVREREREFVLFVNDLPSAESKEAPSQFGGVLLASVPAHTSPRTRATTHTHTHSLSLSLFVGSFVCLQQPINKLAEKSAVLAHPVYSAVPLCEPCERQIWSRGSAGHAGLRLPVRPLLAPPGRHAAAGPGLRRLHPQASRGRSGEPWAHAHLPRRRAAHRSFLREVRLRCGLGCELEAADPTPNDVDAQVRGHVMTDWPHNS